MDQKEFLQESYTGEEHGLNSRKEVFRIHYATGAPEYKSVLISLPASVGQIEQVEEYNGIPELRKSRNYECWYVHDFDCLVDCLPPLRSVEELNRIAWALQEVWQSGRYRKRDLAAFLEAELPEDTEAVLRIIEDYQDYELIQKDDYQGELSEYLWKVNRYPFTEGKQRVADFEHLEQEWAFQVGMIKTDYGYVRNHKKPLRRTFEEAKICLYSPIVLLLYEENRSEPVPVVLEGEEKNSYQTIIQKRIGESLEECDPQGLGMYLTNQLLKQKVKAMIPCAEIINGELYMVLHLDLNQPLTELEYQQLVTEWTFQAEHGWGLEFFERTSKVPKGELFAVFWDSGAAANFTIQTEEELFGQFQQRQLS